MSGRQVKCAHPPCLCEVDEDKKFCTQFCADAGSDEVEIFCDCGHPECADSGDDLVAG